MTFVGSYGFKINPRPLLLPAAIFNTGANKIQSQLNCRKQEKGEGGEKFVAICRADFLSTLVSLAKLKWRQYGSPTNPTPRQEVVNRDLSVISKSGGAIAIVCLRGTHQRNLMTKGAHEYHMGITRRL